MNIIVNLLHLLHFSVIYEPNFNSAELIAKELYQVFRKCWMLSEVNYQLAVSLNASGSIVSIKMLTLNGSFTFCLLFTSDMHVFPLWSLGVGGGIERKDESEIY